MKFDCQLVFINNKGVLYQNIFPVFYSYVYPMPANSLFIAISYVYCKPYIIYFDFDNKHIIYHILYTSYFLCIHFVIHYNICVYKLYECKNNLSCFFLLITIMFVCFSVEPAQYVFKILFYSFNQKYLKFNMTDTSFQIFHSIHFQRKKNRNVYITLRKEC